MGPEQDDTRRSRAETGAGSDALDAIADTPVASSPVASSPVARSPLARALWVALGWLCIAVGAVGVVVPGLPTTPFLVLAAACFVRGSTRLYARLIAHPRFGPLITDFRAGLGIPKRVKVSAIATMVVFVGITLGPGLPAGRSDLRAIVLVTALIGAGYLLSLPTAPITPREERDL
ncbi:Inner membrane protein YbaN [Planctomycetes bacterium Pla163]|uniref:Inner membrane protein YbaN n=1 Tax=Rohdeia mirabilis TaxID=2528008 RepID=A0A518D0U3_9BACT|nr:Inner membrane protein YbaN [Planctomycetes bacterium Pla163]